jgi:phage-related protein (TIGR01555 family)
MQRADGALLNLLTGLGTTADPRQHTGVQRPRYLSPDEINNLVRGHWAARKYVSHLPSEALRKWIELSVEGGPEDAAKQILDKLEELEVRQKLRRALEWERQYGGALLLMGVSDAGDPKEPLNLAAGGQLRFVEAYSRLRVMEPSSADLVSDPDDPRFGHPAIYRIRAYNTGAFLEVHHSRVIVFQGWQPEERERVYDWGVSVLDGLWPAMRDYESAIGYGLGIGARLVETRLKMKGLSEMLTGNASLRDKARAMLQEIHTARSVFRMLPYDANDEVTDANIPFTGFADMIRIARENLAAASGLSLQRFFGLQREGLGDSDESGAERDDAEVAQYQRDRLLGPINRLVEVAAASLGFRVSKGADDERADAEESSNRITSWQVHFVPLREETPTQRAARRLQEAQTAQIYRDLGAVHEDEVREGLRADEDLPYQLEDGSVSETFGPSEQDELELEMMRTQAEMMRQPATASPRNGGGTPPPPPRRR